MGCLSNYHTFSQLYFDLQRFWIEVFGAESSYKNIGKKHTDVVALQHHFRALREGAKNMLKGGMLLALRNGGGVHSVTAINGGYLIYSRRPMIWHTPPSQDVFCAFPNMDPIVSTLFELRDLNQTILES